MGNGFMMLPSYYEALRPLPDEERHRLYDAVMDYAFTGKTPDALEPLLQGYFLLLRPNIDSSVRHYAASVENGKKGGRPKTRREPGKNREKEKEKEMESESESEKDTDAGETAPPASTPNRKRSPFVPPSVDEVSEYVKERGSRVDPQGFIDFYASKGWQIGKTPMKDWKAACRNAENWERWDKKPAPKPYKREDDIDLSHIFGGKW